MRINRNISALKANSLLRRNNNQLGSSLEKLSSGRQINHASDNAAGMAISHKMRTQIRGLDQASNNAANGISVIQTAEGALSEIGEILSRMRELAVQASNDTSTDEDRETIVKEIEQLQEEIERISDTTEFNTKSLLNGNINNSVYSSDANLEVRYISDGVEAGEYKVIVKKSEIKGEGTYEIENVKLGSGFPDKDNLDTKFEDNKIIITGKNNFSMTLYADLDNLKKGESTIAISVLDAGYMELQIGANKNQSISINIPEISPKSLGIDSIDLSNRKDSNDAIKALDGAIATVTEVRSKLGAYENRLAYSMNNLDTSSTNMQEALSRIEDVDMAREISEFTQKNILTQANTAILAQANERPQTILSLLQG